MTSGKMTTSTVASNALQPGRSCPLHYRYPPAALARKADFSTESLYVIGGLYGNRPALDAVLELAAHESSPATLIFNGDFNWFNIDGADFDALNREVLRHHALRGNVETEIAGEDEGAGCGCAYPDAVSEAEVERSNAILQRLRDTARTQPDVRMKLAALPMHQVAEVGGVRAAIVHGDLESLAGWSLSAEALASTEKQKTIIKQILMSECPIIASSHTCVPVAMALETSRGRRAIFNNGAAGMPNFRGTAFGLITRIATSPVRHAQPLYATQLGEVWVEALPVNYDAARWQRNFLANWPAGSPAHQSYYRRISDGPGYDITQANRL